MPNVVGWDWSSPSKPHLNKKAGNLNDVYDECEVPAEADIFIRNLN